MAGTRFDPDGGVVAAVGGADVLGAQPRPRPLEGEAVVGVGAAGRVAWCDRGPHTSLLPAAGGGRDGVARRSSGGLTACVPAGGGAALRGVPVAVCWTEGKTVAVDMDLDELTLELARALAAPAVARFVGSGACEVVVADARGRLAALGGRGEGAVVRAERLLADWRAQLWRVEVLVGGGDAAVREGWFGVAGVALALSAVAGGSGVGPIGPEEGEVLAAAVFCHAVGVLHLPVERGRLSADPVGDMEGRRVRAAGLVRAARGAVGGEREPWLWLELEVAAARAAAAAAVVALEIA